MKETMKEVQAFLLALKEKPFPVDFTALDALITEVNASLSALDFWRGVHRECNHAYIMQDGAVMFTPVDRNYITSDCVVYIRQAGGGSMRCASWGQVGMYAGECVGVRL